MAGWAGRSQTSRWRVFHQESRRRGECRTPWILRSSCKFTSVLGAECGGKLLIWCLEKLGQVCVEEAWDLLVMSQVVLVMKNPSAKAGDVRSRRLNCKTHFGEGLLEEGRATHSRILAWKIPGQRSLAGYSPWGHSRTRLKQLRVIHSHATSWVLTPMCPDALMPLLSPQFDMQRITLEELKHILYHAFRDHLTMKDIENIIINEEESLNETSGNCQTEFEGGKYPFFKIISASFKKQMFILFFIFIYLFGCMGSWASLVAQMVKNMPAMWKTWVRFLGWEDPLEEGNPFQYSCLENPHGQRSLVGYSPWGHSQTRLKQLCRTWLSNEVHTWGLSCIMQDLLLWCIGSQLRCLGLVAPQHVGAT